MIARWYRFADYCLYFWVLLGVAARPTRQLFRDLRADVGLLLTGAVLFALFRRQDDSLEAFGWAAASVVGLVAIVFLWNLSLAPARHYWERARAHDQDRSDLGRARNDLDRGKQAWANREWALHLTCHMEEQITLANRGGPGSEDKFRLKAIERLEPILDQLNAHGYGEWVAHTRGELEAHSPAPADFHAARGLWRNLISYVLERTKAELP